MERGKAGNVIRLARLRKGMTQMELADRLEVNQATVAIWETGRGFPKARNCGKLCDVLDIGIQELFEAG